MNAITHLPLEDRTQLNYGKIRFFKENSYRVSYIPFVGENLFHSSATIRVQTELNGKKQSYLFDTEKGTIQKLDHTQPTTNPSLSRTKSSGSRSILLIQPIPLSSKRNRCITAVIRTTSKTIEFRRWQKRS